MGVIPQYHGSLVAFEGSQDVISTQLRLLPNSPNILIIPPLRYFMKEENVRAPFDVRKHILAVHGACSDRAEIARTFLEESTPSNKRLVFMNGGTAGAQVECVTGISERLTNGDFGKAERIFNRLVRNGVAGLQSRPGPEMESKSPTITTVDHQQGEQDEQGEQVEEAVGDPATEAMRAAEALDVETASLQSNDEVDLTCASRPRSTSVPVFRMTDDFQNAAPFYLFGARRWQRREARNSAPPQLPHCSHTAHEPRKSPQWLLSPATSLTTVNSPTNSKEEKAEIQLPSASLELSSPSSFGFESIPNTPAICEAFVVNIRSSASTCSHKKTTKSVDRIYSSAIRNQDILLCSFPEPPRSRPQGAKTSPISLQDKPPTRSKFASEIPLPTFSTPSRSTVRRGPPSPLRLLKPLQRPVTYVDRSTSPINRYVNRSTTTEPEPTPTISEAGTGDNASIDINDSLEIDPQKPHEPVFPMIENLVILFKAEELDIRLETTIQAFREGKYHISIPPSGSEADTDSKRRSAPSLVEGQPTPRGDKDRMSRVQHAEVAPACQLDSDDYDPFAYGKYLRPPRTWSSRQNLNSHRPFTPPTPAQTPPLRVRRCFHDFTTTNCRTAVCMQNSLRSILNIYFPPEDTGYHQFNFPLLPELSSLWKPVFRETESGTVIQRRRKVDLILAIGAQQGVDSTFLGAISGSLEKLGTKPNGVTRSGRLDMRYLIASAMQAFTSQPLTSQTQDNPFSNPLLLATLIIPHLETYMAAHSATRFLLLEYPPEHLTTVLALQHLVGADLLRIAGILYSPDTSPKPYPGFKPPPRSSTPLPTSPRTTSAALLTPTGTREIDTPSFSKANFLLTSSANESEIATLISTVWKILIERSTFYIPEGVALPRSSIQIDRDRESGSGGGSDVRRESQSRPLAQTPLINTAQQYAPLANAAATLGFSDQQGVRGSESTECVVGASQPQSPQKNRYSEANPPPPPPPKQKGAEGRRVERMEAQLKSTRGSVAETIRSHSTRTARTMRSQRAKIRNMLSRDTDVDADVLSSRADAGSLSRERERDRIGYGGGDEEYWWDDADDDGFAAEERKYMPLYGRRQGPRKGNSRKALKWLGLAT
ncbi:hypothetical protein GGS26DRAFT_592937 [Hypomontagnella submonticulosa]|nr:hypothetical protein GGS26DRAFT_592937 [Hypomontagnella submonticulosa]